LFFFYAFGDPKNRSFLLRKLATSGVRGTRRAAIFGVDMANSALIIGDGFRYVNKFLFFEVLLKFEEFAAKIPLKNAEFANIQPKAGRGKI